ncbi:hypothetical protein [Halalkalicoccus jeotgali]|uniref:Uncharacterized protein n=1 Tax=Halalkalicoccus jeotgali (strain DSM 18796 / CECT 7217 / JCM 14584 / KCTC 4019 / B3) TaxID=795797 RepID=D8JAB8_HALJB|nr:hypothetical protein [Halalkalicoccus jeotgali]ADJ14640.1 hypothetical protein HacjB3_06245 [Halalkalicoccus jeotgali B3]ELY39538.1 hypothetical protein C497_04642 [Halalkalicoccus jeotgali B3]
MEDVVLALLFSIGSLLAFVWFGYRGAIVYRLYRSVSNGGGSDRSDLVDGRKATVEGDIVIEQAANETYPGETTLESVPAALLLWRVRKRKNRSDGWDMVESGLESGVFKLDTGGGQIRVDTDWLVKQHGDTGIDSLTPSDLKSESFRDSLAAKTGVVSRYVYFDRFRDTVDAMKTVSWPPNSYQHLERSRQNYRIEVAMAPEAKSLTVHGQVAIEQGEVVLSGSDSVPMAIADTGIESLESNLRAQMTTSGVYAFGSLIASAAFFYVWVLPELPL